MCGFPRKDTVPLPYPHLLAFALHMAIMGDPAFPYPAIGTVHLENTITAHRAIGVGEVLDLARPSVGAPRPHPKGTPARLRHHRHRAAGETVVGVDLDVPAPRAGATPDAAGGLVVEGAPTGGVEWRLPGRPRASLRRASPATTTRSTSTR